MVPSLKVMLVFIINCKSINFCQSSAYQDSLKFTGLDRKSVGTVDKSDDQSARKWKSMFDVSGGKSGSPSVNTVTSPVSPTKPARAKTPTFSVFSKSMSSTGSSGIQRRTSSPSAMHYGIALPLKSCGCWIFCHSIWLSVCCTQISSFQRFLFPSSLFLEQLSIGIVLMCNCGLTQNVSCIIGVSTDVMLLSNCIADAGNCLSSEKLVHPVSIFIRKTIIFSKL